MHLYESDPQSGAGNCKCGWAEHTKVHPHAFQGSLLISTRCVCGLWNTEHTAVHKQGCLGMHWGDCEVSDVVSPA